ncbi:MAG: type II toxin-antitoxin system Phd/YefM family antitoxin [Deltaproteobacteria bacterium]|nr:type II toxin-antitoxin system Phd/YefM family antitoxin [Deltaproteobacteria bacterium]
MREVSSTELARQLSQVLDLVESKGEEIVIVRNKQRIARILPGPVRMTALEALSDLYRTLPEQAAKGWVKESRHSSLGKQNLNLLKNPWDI